MSKLSNELQMIKLLMNHRKYTIKELSERLEVSERMIRIYKDDIEKSGIFIDSYKGKNGGYILYDNIILPDLKISKYDIELLESMKKQNITSCQNDKLNMLISKLKYNYISVTEIKSILPDNINSTELLNLVNDCCKNRNKIKIFYESLNGDVKERTIHPCTIFLHGDDDWVIAAFCELRGEVRLFNLDRIKKYEILNVFF